jgi:hypothetical protein
VNSRTDDPLVRAVVDGTLDGTQRTAVAELLAVIAGEMVGDSLGTEGSILDHTMVEAGRWGTVRKTWRSLHPALYPSPGVRT